MRQRFASREWESRLSPPLTLHDLQHHAAPHWIGPEPEPGPGSEPPERTPPWLSVTIINCRLSLQQPPPSFTQSELSSSDSRTVPTCPFVILHRPAYDDLQRTSARRARHHPLCVPPRSSLDRPQPRPSPPRTTSINLTYRS